MKTFPLFCSLLFAISCGSDDADKEMTSPAVSADAPLDGDGDGVLESLDCNDADPTVFPGAPELCNDVDDDCDGDVDEDPADGDVFYYDGDGDGFGIGATAVTACDAPEQFASADGDCNDSNEAVHPEAPEDDCTDPVDYNCDGSVGYADADGDGSPACEDCNDANEAIHPGQDEVCNGGVDDNCDGSADGPGSVGESTWYADADGDLHGDPDSVIEACDEPEGYVSNATDCDDSSATANPSGVEVCDGIDNDCDGEIDGDGAFGGATVYRDADGDGIGVESDSVFACDDLDGYASAAGDCDDESAAVYPGAVESCDGIDNDCSGVADDGLVTVTYYADPDGDGYGLASASVDSCIAVDGYAPTAGDCDESDAAVNPGAVEVCDGVDNDCSGVADDGLATETYYADPDGDGYGLATVSIESCSAVDGYAPIAGDCDEDDAAVNPGASEACDGIDNDCSGTADDGLATGTYYADPDGDGYGLTAVAIESCAVPVGYVTVGGDCSEGNAAINPGAVEVCDGVDNDCSGSADEGLTSVFYADADGDGVGIDADTAEACSVPDGYSTTVGDCAPSDGTVFPGAVEVCDGVDNDCNTEVDDADAGLDVTTATAFYADLDADDYGAGDPVYACEAPAGHTTDNTDCLDSDNGVYPGAPETWYDGIDQDCEGDSDFDADGDGYDSEDYGGVDVDDADDSCVTECIDGLTEDNPADTCAQLADDFPELPNDWYWIAPMGVAFEAFCDLENGGWTQCFELVNTPDEDFGTSDTTWLDDCIDFTGSELTGEEVRITLENSLGVSLYDESGTRTADWSYNAITSTADPVDQYDWSNHDRVVTLSNGDSLTMAGQNSANAGCGGSLGNGYSVVVHPAGHSASTTYYANIKMMVMPNMHVVDCSWGCSGTRSFAGWSTEHEISYNAGTMNTCGATTSQLGTFAFWVR